MRSPSLDSSLLPASPATARALSDAALVTAMRTGDELAIREFLLRFHSLLMHHAGRLGVQGGDRSVAVEETLADAALYLIAPAHRVPQSVAGYLVTALRNRFLNARRAGSRAERRVGEPAAAGYAESGDPALELLLSQGSLRAARGPLALETPATPHLARLGHALDAMLTDEERTLLVWVSNHVPYREIAGWLDIGYAAVGKRVERLRTRLRAAAAQHAATLPDAERTALRQFFHRAGLGPELAGPAPSPAPSPHAPATNSTRAGGIDEDPAHVPQA